MGFMLNGEWKEKNYTTTEKGKFKRDKKVGGPPKVIFR
jgi:hypothetical protein